ncbi:MAG: hypothetical protein D8M58_09955 [Calditrichaeota bacterium]|nr:MAG: hypothetical protein DWQ03_09330 [Calditrichota bacterium]MBL1205712.1 hypothetical protein [Calditrichota bacterium]NOG45540.1 hypothetical protein [Calditrichota bacterium]
MKKIVLILLISVPLVAQIANMNLNKIYFGQPISTVTARSMALGGAGLAGGNAFLAGTHNPALAINSDGMISINGGSRLYNLEEDRAFPYVDNFGGFVDFGSYYYQNNWYGSFYGQIVYAPDMIDFMNLHISTGFVPFMDFDYDYFEEVRSPGFGDELIAYNIIENGGQLSAIPINIAVQPIEGLSVGLGVSFLVGDVNYSERIVSKSTSFKGDSLINVDNTLDGMPNIITAGVSYQIDERLTVGSSYRFPYTVKTDVSLATNTLKGKTSNEAKYPARIGAGVDYRFENILAAQIMVDYYYEFWSDFENDLFANSFDDTYNLRVGVEHIFFDNVPFRAGLSFGTLREDKSLTQTTFTLGTGFVFKNVRADIAFGYSNNQYFQKDLFSDDLYGISIRNEELDADTDRVSWTQVFGRIDFSYSFE